VTSEEDPKTFRPVLSGLLWAQGLGIFIEKPWKIYSEYGIEHQSGKFLLDDLDAKKNKNGSIDKRLSVLRITVKRYLKHFVAGKKIT